jgi:hypothetical protein
MKTFILPLFYFFIYSNLVFSNGVCIVDGANNIYFEMKSSDLDVNINNQVATIVSTQVFENTTENGTLIKFGYPLTETASATQLRWQIDGNWYYASFAPTVQDTIIPGGSGGGSGAVSNAQEYLGEFPLYFDLEQVIPAGSQITFELTYVDLLPYGFNIVTFSHAGDYSWIQSTPLETFEINYHLISSRTIDWVDLLDQADEVISNSGNEADLTFSKTNFSLTQDIIIEYQLNASELGLFDFSTLIPDSILACDNHGEGFFTLIVEPDPSNNTQVIEKIFTLVIDRSGSMSGDKIVQAREAATFIVNNLNLGDEFNIVDFSSDATSFEPDHVPFNLDSQNEALAYIQGISSDGGTQILGALETAISQFSNNDPDKASIILFFTDGLASNSTTDILQGVSNAIASNNVEDLSLFSFGIGDDVNKQLLTLLATQNNGFAEFVDNQALAEVISQFYLTVQNPVLLNTTVTFSPEVVIEAYPQDLPNLFKGQQLILVGRYEEAQMINMTLSGNAFGDPISYDYAISLSDTLNPSLQFLPRLWAKNKMDHLFTEFLSAGNDTLITIPINDSIVDISFCYGVLSPLTSFDDNASNGGGNGNGNTVSVESDFEALEDIQLLPSFPNPFQEEVTVRFYAKDFFGKKPTLIKIFDAQGKLIRIIEKLISPNEWNEFLWDGKNSSNQSVANGIYFIVIENGDKALRSKVVKMSR